MHFSTSVKNHPFTSEATSIENDYVEFANMTPRPLWHEFFTRPAFFHSFYDYRSFHHNAFFPGRSHRHTPHDDHDSSVVFIELQPAVCDIQNQWHASPERQQISGRLKMAHDALRKVTVVVCSELGSPCRAKAVSEDEYRQAILRHVKAIDLALLVAPATQERLEYRGFNLYAVDDSYTLEDRALLEGFGFHVLTSRYDMQQYIGKHTLFYEHPKVISAPPRPIQICILPIVVTTDLEGWYAGHRGPSG